MKKLLSLLMVFVLMFTALGCSKKGSQGTSIGNTKVFASIADEDKFKQTIVSGMESYADENNVELDVAIAHNNVETQVQQIKDAKTKGYDAIVCILVESDTAQQIINAAGDIPVIFTNVEPDSGRLKSDKYIYVGSDENEAAKYTFESLKEYFKDKKSFNAVLFEGSMDSKSASVRTESLKSQLKKNGFDVNYVFQDDAGWDREKAKKMFEAFLKLNVSYDCIISNNDEMALGVIDAMEENGIDPSKVPILGLDATQEACKAISNGKMSFSIKQSGEGQGESVIKAAQALKNGDKISKIENGDSSGKYIWYPYSKVDKSNVQQYMR
ncbi:sugar ABC transporter substrate-binding protein [Clostridium butyricum]|uniref:ABC-type sugar transport system, periplasmic component n=1 Tax=Clostridium butyricum E4 str. BoNT E BL5262 TaxID=632245 RepID=C4ILH6_CLOBU|nr:sugar ABC transporter substrate-binding protein [Clostridium butyricum]EDT76268.1 putative rhizopine uptake ABC transporter periplasmic solute-binding protein [Clostridium butyricum 5521]EEP52640.1 ABC-type sugar transport system, periplasmic component [Clostridium butyricum E4 str. BoNT E BL5262]NFL33070.1 substrate-binding domain-containing protein [Clostridium butyricum]NFS20375.1 substrate-binding domain-containing protein [Clostridium butyricum]